METEDFNRRVTPFYRTLKVIPFLFYKNRLNKQDNKIIINKFLKMRLSE